MGLLSAGMILCTAFLPIKSAGQDMQVILYRFEITTGKEQKFKEWMAWQHKNQ